MLEVVNCEGVTQWPPAGAFSTMEWVDQRQIAYMPGVPGQNQVCMTMYSCPGCSCAPW